MTRKSNLTAKLTLGVPTLAIVGAVFWIAGIDQVQAGSLQKNSAFARAAGISKASGLKRRIEINSRARTRLSVPKQRFQANKQLRAGSLSKATAVRKSKSITLSTGHSRLAISSTDRSRLQMLHTKNRTRKFGRVVNIGSVNGQKKTKRARGITISTAHVEHETGVAPEYRRTGDDSAALEFETDANSASVIGQAIGNLASNNNDDARSIKYRPQFYFRTTDVTGDSVKGPLPDRRGTCPNPGDYAPGC